MFDSAPCVSGILARADLRESPPYRPGPLPVREYPGKS
jgi:hypothetical protein